MTRASGDGSLIAVVGVASWPPGDAVAPPGGAVTEAPPERLGLELGWGALEDAGIPAGDPRSGRVGLFLAADAAANPAAIVGRMSEVLGLAGPGIAVDAEPSSSAALRLACESLGAGECEVALVAGLRPDHELPGIVVLELLPEALRRGDPVYCAIGDVPNAALDGSEWGRPDIRRLGPEGLTGIARLIEIVRAIGPAEEAQRSRGSADPPLPGQVLWPVSGRSEDALGAQAAQLADFLESNPGLDPAELGLSLATGRAHSAHRAVCIGSDLEQLRVQLSALAAGAAGGGPSGRARAAGRGPVFVFPGQGGQWPRMAADLLSDSPAFAAQMDACEEALEPFVDWSLREAVCDGSGTWFGRLDVLQPALLMTTIALARLWGKCGIEPEIVIGQSQGEIAAAHIAGGLSLDDAARLGALHSRISMPLIGRGGMVAVGLPAAAVAERLEGFGERLSIAGINGPASVVVSGEVDPLEQVLAQWGAEGVSAQRIAVNYAAHSAQIEAVRDEMLAAFAPISPRSGEVPFHSTVTGAVIDTAELGPEYWYRNLREVVRLEPVFRALLEGGSRAFIEIGPHPVLSFGLQETIDAVLGADDDSAVTLSTLRREEGGAARFAAAVAEAHVAGVEVDWRAFFAMGSTPRVRLPARSFDQAPRGPGAGGPRAGRLAAELVDLTESARREAALALVVTELAGVLDLGAAAGIDPDASFRELGLESLGAVELRNRLRARTDVPLPTTAIFDWPTPAGLAALLVEKALGRAAPSASPTRVPAGGGDEPIAIVGMACRYPGGIDRPQDLWQALLEERDLIGAFPDDRGWDLERLRNDDALAFGADPRGGFLSEPGGFDAELFGVSPREALATDPQQRVLLEVAWQALEEAGIDPTALRESPTGVFAGISSQDYTSGLRATARELDGYRLTGSLTSLASGRIAYRLGLEGPAITVDTACSSSLVAIHLAARALRGGECSLALAGGATILGSPGLFVDFAYQRGLAPDGRCKAFAEAADGVGFAEGVGLIVLERLSEAQANGHRVLATIRGSAVNQDGASNGLTAPNGPSQERVIRQALADARLEPGEIDFVEAHGTGTTLGDPIEANALLATYGQQREEPLRLGSIKSNIGHTQAAAGVAGVIKTVLAMREGVMPKTLHVDRPSSKIDWGEGKVELLGEALPWPTGEGPRRAAVSAFGISGTNAHLILEEAPVSDAAGPDPTVREGDGAAGEPPLAGVIPLVLAAKSEPALAAQAERLATRLRESPDLDPLDAAYSLVSGRASFEHRAVCLGSDREQALEALDSLAGGGPDSPLLVRGRARENAKAALLFPGQGSQWQGMALELLESSPAFAHSMGECEAALAPHLDFELSDVLQGAAGAPALDRVEVVQPALFAVLVSLARLWQACGLQPAAVAGHSQGEIAAAHIAGGLSLDDAARLAAVRARLLGKIAGKGGMVSLIVARERVEPLLAPWDGELSIAAYNGPSSTIVSGASEALEQLLAHCEQEGVRARAVAVDYASHSDHVEGLREEILEAFADLAPRSGSIPFHSTVTGGPLDTAELDAEYWYRNLRQPVLFEQVCRGLIESGHRALIEVSPHPVFPLAVGETIEQLGDGASVIETLRREEAGAERFGTSLAQAHAAGAQVKWSALFAGSGAKSVPLPTYPFQRKRYWLSPASAASDPAAIGQRSIDHPFLAAAIEDPEGGGISFSGRISLDAHPWLADHAVLDTALFPGTAFLDLALVAAEQVDLPAVAELTLHAPLVLAEAAVALRVSVGAADAQGGREIAIHSRPEGEEGAVWTRNASGLLSSRAVAAPEPLAAWPPPGAEPIVSVQLHARLAEAGFEYGPAFSGLTAAWQLGEEVYAEVSLSEQAEGAAGFALHPALLDAALHPIALGAGQGVSLPFAWSGASLAPSASRQLRVRIAGSAEQGAAIELFDPAGAPLGTIESLLSRPLDSAQIQGAASAPLPLYELGWAGTAIAAEPPATELWRAPLREPAAASELATVVLGKLQQWLATEPPDSRLAILVEGALAGDGELPDPTAAAIDGLVGAAASEHPGRFLLIDSDGSEASEAAIEKALAIDPREGRIALRRGELRVPRLAALSSAQAEPSPPLDPERTVLVTGGTGGLGALVARHLVEAHGARHLLLASRSGEWARGAAELAVDLGEQGAEVNIAACDVSDRGQLEELLGSIPAEHPLGAVIHCAGVLDDATIETASAEQLERVFGPKADAAQHLHELTAGIELSHFVCFSSIAGILGTAGQGAYAAANRFLDGLVELRRAQGLAATSIAWGLWDSQSTMVGSLGEADLARMRRAGIEAFSAERGLACFDAALARGQALSAAAHFDRGALRAQATAGGLPVLLEGLVGTRARVGEGSSLAARLAAVPEEGRAAEVLELVRSEVAAVLGHESVAAVDPDKAFKDLGFDSLAAVELRNRLKTSTGMRLASTAVFDYPSAGSLASHLLAEVSSAGGTRKRAARARRSEEPIAIVGIGCHLPGGADSAEQLWELVAAGGDGIVPFPANRDWDLAGVYDPDPEHPGTSYVREGGFLDDPTSFDAEFFAIAPREATAMDPQHRLLLETAWEALEDAGIDPGELRGEPAGVFAGAAKGDYSSAVDGYQMIGGQLSILAGRVSYTLGLEGPAMTVDTACSSSLVAMHLAAAALRAGECSLALAGGVTVHSTPEMFVDFSRQGVLAADARSKAFGAAANGTVFSDGVGVLVLERLSDAEANGHRILATIRGSAVNQDGASNGLTAPNGPSQERVIRQALASAGLEPGDIDAVEAHGTGTPLGDPIEAGALIAAYDQDRLAPLKLGSIKSNIGHTVAAAGVAGVIKMTMAMRAGVLPKTLHAEPPSPAIDWSAAGVELLTEAVEWKPGGRPRRAAVSAFGISGTNAHLILEEAPVSDAAGPDPTVREGDGAAGEPPLAGVIPLVLAAKSEPALAAQAERLATRLRESPDLDPLDAAYSLVSGRASFEHRAVCLGSDREQALEALDSLAGGGPDSPLLVRGRARENAKAALLFPGQGSQWQGMALELLESSPAFAHSMGECEAALAPHLDFELSDVLQGAAGAPALDRVEVVQPALFAVLVSLARLWQACGLQPAAVAGHSQGEIAAAHIAGGLSLDDAARLAAVRARLLGKIAGKGGMVSLIVARERVEPLLAPWDGELSIAAYNGPSSTIVSGASEALEQLLAHCEQEGVRARAVAVDYASHSDHVEGLREEILEAFADLAPRSGSIPFHSTVTGGPLDTAELDAEYWYRNLRQPVLFEQVCRGLIESGHRALIEVSPHPVFPLAVGETIEQLGDGASVIETLRREEAGAERFGTSLAQAHAAGAQVKWSALFAGSGAKSVPLPTYPFQRKRYWLSPASAASDPAAIGQRSIDHPFLAAAIEDPEGGGISFSGRISLDAHPWLADHAVLDTALFPGTAFLDLALVAAEQVDLPAVAELTLHAPLVLAEAAVALRVSVGAADAQGGREIAIHSRPEGEEGAVWTRNASGLLSSRAVAAPEPLAAWPPPGAEPIVSVQLHARLAEAGFEYGPAFSGLTAAWQLGEEVYAEVSLSEQAEGAAGFALHPALLDAALHPIALGAGQGVSLPFAWSGASLAPSASRQLRVRIAGSAEQGAAIELFDPAGAPLGTIESLLSRPLDSAQIQGAASAPLPLYELGWELLAPSGAAAPPTEIWRLPRFQGGVAAAREATLTTLEKIQGWLSSAPEDVRLAILTEGGPGPGEAEPADLAATAIWGLVRSAASEHPGRFLLIDSDGSEASEAAIEKALAVDPREGRIALRGGELLVARLAPAKEAEGETATCFDPDRTVLISGGTGGIGALVARHLVEAHGARHLLLATRSGERAPGALDLRARLQELGAAVEIAACDVSDRGQLEELLGLIPAKHPLGAVIHCAGVLDDGLVESLDQERLERVFAPKADAAWHLHELTVDLELSHFVCFSSLAGILGSPGQGSYAAANCFLDGLAAQRRAQGLAATSIAWGLWASESAMAGDLGDADLARLRRAGIDALSEQQGLALFDRALASPLSPAVAAQLDRAGLRAEAAAGGLPALLERVAGARAKPSRGAGGSFALRLREAPESARERLAEDYVRAEVAAILGHASAAEIGRNDSFKDLGFDSLAAVELRNRLNLAVGLRLPATVVFDYPDAEALSRKLLAEAADSEHARPAVAPARSAQEPVAIVGMACRYPGDVSSPAELWQLVRAGSDAVGDLPSDRGWDPSSIYALDPERPELGYRHEGGFLADAGDFDPSFFSISPREAVAIDPQQRLALESSWEALEDAGIDPQRLRGSSTGVFTGVMHHDYGVSVIDSSGMGAGLASGRVSYALGLEGPAMTVDTACSSSLVAMHLATASLRAGECSLALAGGATVLATPAVFGYFSRQQGLARDGRCKAFSDEADGVGIAEGAGVLVLERLTDAEANGHRVLATIRGSAVNQDGASNGLTAPNGPSQERVIRQALANAGLKPSDVDMVEAHGTGTALGDPIEAGALLATYGQERETPVRLGSLKSNIGHTQAAAGVAGVIKAVMAMRAGLMPKTLHVDAPSSQVEWESGAVELLAESREWEANGRPRRAAVSSFGATGTNAHVILEGAPGLPSAADGDAGAPATRPGASAKDQSGEEGTAPAPLTGPLPLLLSARSPAALAAQAARLGAQLRGDPEQELADVAYSLATTRAQLEQRAVLIATEREQLLGDLDALAEEQQPAGVILAKALPGSKLVYLFSGQGSQRPGMGQHLYTTYPAYAGALDQAAEQIDPLIGRSLSELIFSAPGTEAARLLDHTTYAQPALFATELALYRLLESLGLTAELLCGHSVGEITAAHLAGVFSLADAAKLICARGALMGELPAGGAMLAIEATEAEALASIEGSEAKLSLAAVNSPSACVLSGAEEAVQALEAHWREAGRKTKRLAVSHAFHSPLMEPMLEPFAALARTLTYNPPKLALFSCLDGELLSAERATDPAHWVAHAREPVRFAAAIAGLQGEGASAYLELGPDPVLCAMARQCLGEEPTLAPTLREGRAEAETLLSSLATAHASGAQVKWSAFFAGSGAKSVPLPTYPFQRKRYWLSPASAASDPAAIGQRSIDHPFLAAAIEDPEGEGIAFSGRLSLSEHPWLKDHAVLGSVLFPGTAFLELALFAGQQAGAPTVEELTLQAPLVLGESATALRVSVSGPDEQGKREITIHSRPEAEEQGEGWTRNAAGTLSAQLPDTPEPLPAWPPPGAEELAPDDLHARLAEAGFEYGPAFQGLTAAWRDGEDLYAEVSLSEQLAGSDGGFALHPALLDVALHPVALEAGEGVRVPFAWNGASLEPGGSSELRVKISGASEGARIELFDAIGAPLGRIDSLLARPLDPEQVGARAKTPLFSLRWARPAAQPMAAAPLELWRAPEPGLGALGARGATLATLGKIQAWLAAEPEDARLAILTESALPATEADCPDPAAAALSGLIGAAAAEHPGRFLLIDSDGSEASEAVLEQALSTAPGESHFALREGELLAPRLVAAAGEESEPVKPLDREATVLISGATGGLGALIAKHLVESHGARRLLLASRSGEWARGAAELGAALRELGAEVEIAACDVSDRVQLEELLGSIPAEHSLGAVIHCAGVLDDATIETASPEQLERVFAPKADAAAHLHELTAGLELSHFVLFSSLAGVLGSAGQGAYAAANAFLDGLAAQRHAQGLPASSIAWGLWQSESTMVDGLGEADLARMRRAGIEPLSEQQGLALFDAVLASPRPLSVAARFDRGTLQRQARAGALPALLEGMVAPAARRGGSAATLARRLREAPESARERLAEDYVRAEVAAILGHASAAAIGPDDSFRDLGFDSLAAIELRNRLGAAVGQRLAASVVFDHPTAAALAVHLLGDAAAEKEAEQPAPAPAPSQVAARLEQASDEELLEFIDKQVGSSRG